MLEWQSGDTGSGFRSRSRKTYRKDQSQRMDRIEFNSLKTEVEELKTEVESLKCKTLCLLVTFVVFVIFASFSVVNISRQYSTIHDYYMDSRSTDQEISQSLEELIPKIEVLQSEFK